MSKSRTSNKVAKKAARKKKPAAKKASRKVAKKSAGRKTSKARSSTKPAVAPTPSRMVPEGSDSLLLIVSGPSGAGKSTLVRRLAQTTSRIWRSVSMTTRGPRAGEMEGIDYIYATRVEFESSVAQGGMLEHAEVHGQFYGTPRGPVVERLSQGRDVLLEIDVQGAQRVRQLASDAILIFVVPPSREELERRLRGRGSESDEAIARRLAGAERELAASADYDYLVMNDDIEKALGEMKSIMIAERARYYRRRGVAWWS